MSSLLPPLSQGLKVLLGRYHPSLRLCLSTPAVLLVLYPLSLVSPPPVKLFQVLLCWDWIASGHRNLLNRNLLQHVKQNVFYFLLAKIRFYYNIYIFTTCELTYSHCSLLNDGVHLFKTVCISICKYHKCRRVYTLCC